MEINRQLRNSDYLYIAAFFVLIAGVVLGSVYLAKMGDDSGESVRGYLESFVQSVAERDCISVFKRALKENMILTAVIFVSGFFRFGAAFTAAAVVRKGFVTGFTSASFIKYYGWKGLLAMSATMPSVIVILPAMLFFAAVSVSFSFSKERRQKKQIILYIACAGLVLLTFLIASLAEGYLTTNLMKWLCPKL